MYWLIERRLAQLPLMAREGVACLRRCPGSWALWSASCCCRSSCRSLGARRLLGLHKRKEGPAYLAAILERAAFGFETQDDWDDLKRAPFRDPALEAIRLRAIPYAPPMKLDRAERDALHTLMEEAKGLQAASVGQ